MEWKYATVFISSSFNDMHAERDYLIKEVFPELTEWCEKYKIRLSDIDLRWGVSEETSKNKNTIEKCLSHIDKSRPFFLCFLGQRRGWIPDFAEDISDETKETLSSLGTNGVNKLQTGMSTALPVLSALFGGIAPFTDMMNGMAGSLNGFGQNIVDEFRTDTRHMFGGSIMLTQPVFMGGAIVAMNKMADLGEEMAANSADARRQETLYQIDKAYWQVVSLHHKQKLAEGFLELVKKLDGDVQKMIREGVATRSEGLSVSVKVNEAEMAVMKVNDGLTLSKMLLCQLCGLPVNEQVTLEDEMREELSVKSEACDAAHGSVEEAMANRPELKMLQNLVDINHQAVNLLKAGNLPQVLLAGGYTATNPNVGTGVT